MKSHEMAKHLTLMAKVLRKGPNVELEDIELSNAFSRQPLSTKKEDIPKALSLLVNLNQVNKQDWLKLIEDYGFDVPARARDANRDIIGKLLKYLAENPDERERLTGKRISKKNASSEELADALSILLN